MIQGVTPMQFITMPVAIDQEEKTRRVRLQGSATFTNWLMLKKKINSLPANCDIMVDFSGAKYVDHTVMTRLQELRKDFEAAGRKLTVAGLDHHKSMSHDALAARRLKST
jgi:MFS superfamily sulfate permease-like transporter